MEPSLQGSPVSPVVIKLMKLILILFATLIVFVFGYIAYKTLFVRFVIKSYEECIKTKGSIMQLSYPPVCITKDGLRFTQQVTPVTL